MRRSGHNLSIPLPSCSFRQPIYYTDQMQRSLDSFCRKRSLRKSCEEEWKIEKNNKEQVQFTTLWKAPWKQYKEKRKQEGGISHEE